MKFHLIDGTEIIISKEQDRFIIYPEVYQTEFESYISDFPVVSGGYCPEKPDWIVVKEIIEVYMFNRMVESVDIEGITIEPMEYEPGIIY